ncbi:unnamed protein product [Porites lobata]|uniref:Uncharacterized protein n=1 Tax=Porites lobata TaxID=104759 RepID=A0ABN8PLA2_9CNID|nr:unnamed protein product [Porites lobata]
MLLSEKGCHSLFICLFTEPDREEVHSQTINVHEDSNDSVSSCVVSTHSHWQNFINGQYSESEAVRKALALSIEESRILFAIFQLPVTLKKSCKDRCEPHVIVVSDGMVRKIYLTSYKSFVNKCWLITVSITTTLYQLLTLADKLRSFL